MRTLEWAFQSPDHLMAYLEGCVNDFETGISTKNELMIQLGDFTVELVKKTQEACFRMPTRGEGE